MDVIESVSKLDPWALVNYLEEAQCYAESNIVVRRKSIQSEMKHIWKGEDVCVSSSKKYIKQMEREIQLFEDRGKLVSDILMKIRMGEFSKR